MHPEGHIYIRYGVFDSSVEVFLCCAKLVFHTDAANYDMMIVLCSCVITPNNFYVMSECVRNVHHLSQLPDCLVAVALTVLLWNDAIVCCRRVRLKIL